MSTDLVVQGTELVPTSTLFGTDNPAEVVNRAAVVARTLEQLVRKQNLIVKIGQGEHVRVEGWTLLGSMLGVFPIVEWTRPVLVNDEFAGWEARVEARTRSGEIVGAAEAECLRSESAWSFDPPPNKYGKKPAARDDFALRSMAQTRAVSKALRLPLGFVMQLAGFDPTPAEEMPVIDARRNNDPAAGTPFSYDHEEPLDPPLEQILSKRAPSEPSPQVTPPSEGAPKRDTTKMKKKLDVLVGKLRPDHLSTLQLWQSMGREPVLSEDGLLHWKDLRESLTWDECMALIDRLETYAKVKAA